MRPGQARFWLLATSLLGILALAGIGGRLLWIEHQQRLFAEYLSSPIPLGEQARVSIAAGTPLSGVARQLAAQGVVEDPAQFSRSLIELGHERSVQAGQYLFEPGTSHAEAIDKLVSGDVHQEKFRLIEGTTFATVLENLAAAPEMVTTLEGLGADEIWQRVSPGSEHPPEGMLLPDTYLYGSNSTDVEILRSAHSALVALLAAEWGKRAQDLPLDSPYEALTLASIIEKESGIAAERGLIASVFVNRLRKGMRLQSDPTVIYGMGDSFDGNLTREDLREPSEHNTYTNSGLPPTPIAMVSPSSLRAALNPEDSDYYYFVADGSGGHVFSRTLREHNNAVNRYQRGR